MQCGAKNRDGTACRRHTMRYGKRCPAHGGKSPQAIAKAAEREAADKARRVAERHGFAPITDPLSELLMLGGEIKSIKDALSARAGDSTSNAAAFERSVDRLHRLLTDVARLDIEERLARIAGSQVERMIESLLGTITVVLAELGHDIHDERVKPIVMDALRRAQKDLNAAPNLQRLAIRG